MPALRSGRAHLRRLVCACRCSELFTAYLFGRWAGMGSTPVFWQAQWLHHSPRAPPPSHGSTCLHACWVSLRFHKHSQAVCSLTDCVHACSCCKQAAPWTLREQQPCGTRVGQADAAAGAGHGRCVSCAWRVVHHTGSDSTGFCVGGLPASATCGFVAIVRRWWCS